MDAQLEAPSRFGLIVGAMKCGTTSLFNYLAAHPEVAPCRSKEPNFFSSAEYRPEDRDAYFALWDWQPAIHKIAVEASVNYAKMPTFPNCAQRVAGFSPRDFRFIYCMRNPVDRIESHVYHGLHAGWTRPIEDGISDHTLDVSRYAMQLDAYRTAFGRDKLLLVVLEEFEKAPKVGLRRVCEFLDIDADFDFQDLTVSHNQASDHYTEHPMWERLRGLEPLRQIWQIVPARLRRSMLRSTGSTFEGRRELSTAERREIEEALRPDLARLESEYEIDVGASWGLETS